MTHLEEINLLKTRLLNSTQTLEETHTEETPGPNVPADPKHAIIVYSGYIKVVEPLIKVFSEELAEIRIIQNAWSDCLKHARAVDNLPTFESVTATINYSDLLRNSRARLRELNKIKVDFEVKRDMLIASTTNLNPNLQAPTANVATNPVTVSTNSIPLPPLKLKNFSGRAVDWPEFWELFDSVVNKSTTSEIQKLSYLKSLVEGEAGKLIGGLVLSDANFEVAINLLKDRYGNDDLRVRELNNKLINLKPCYSHDDAKYFQTQLECLCRQLEAMHQSLENSQLRMLLNKNSFDHTFVKLSARKRRQPRRHHGLRRHFVRS